MKNVIRIAVTLAAVAAAFGVADSAHALPAYAQKEGKSCSYCHLKPSGGARNYRGKFYRANDHTFANFDDAAEASKAGVEIGPEPTPLPKSYTAPAAPAPKPEENKPEEPKPAENKPAEPKPGEMPAPAVNNTDPTATPASVVPPTLPLAEATKKAKEAEAIYLKNKKNPQNRTNFGMALALLGQSTMANADVPPAKRYPAALKHFRRALILDPKNKPAAEGKKQIEDVYKSMGKPLPK